MNRTHLMVIGLAAAALLGLHADTGWLFVIMATAVQSPSPIFAGHADLAGRAPLVHGQRRHRVPVVLLTPTPATPTAGSTIFRDSSRRDIAPSRSTGAAGAVARQSRTPARSPAPSRTICTR